MMEIHFVEKNIFRSIFLFFSQFMFVELLKRKIFALFLFIIIGLISGCSDVKFSKSTEDLNCDSNEQQCIDSQAEQSFDYQVKISGGKVDILIVNDNSASMSFEQNRLSPRFSDFIRQLENKKADYRIAMTTTDISSAVNPPRSINQNGLLQDGKLISFGQGIKFLTPETANKETKFNSTIVRSETLNCENFIANWVKNNGIGSTETSSNYNNQYIQNCPSGDERGIFAANLVVNNNPDAFIRKDAHLAIIFISDEDIRSGLYKQKNSGFNLSKEDQPDQLIGSIYNQYGQGKSISVHAVVVKDSICLNEQNNQKLGNPAVNETQGVVSGSIGDAYLTFISSGWGKSANICSSDYTSQLGQIGTSIIDKIDVIELRCEEPKNLIITVSSNDSSLSYNVSGRQVKFNKTLPIGTNVSLKYSCSSL